MPADSACKLSIIRRSDFADRRRSYKIFVNDKEVGVVTHNAVLDVEVPSGQLKVEARIDWTGSQPLTLEVVPHQVVAVEISNRIGLWGALWGATFGRRSYLLLKQIGSSP